MGDGLEVRVRRCKVVGNGFSYLRHGQSMKPAGERLCACPAHGLGEFGCIFCPKDARLLRRPQIKVCKAPFEAPLFFECENIQCVADQSVFDQGLGNDPSEAFQVQRLTFCQILEPPNPLCRTV